VISTLISWVISAAILWVLSLLPFGFLEIGFTGGIISFLIVAIVIGLINALIVPIVKGLVKGKNGNATLLILIISLVIDAAALWFAGWLPIGFYIGFFPTAIIAAVLLTIVNAGFAAKKER